MNEIKEKILEQIKKGQAHMKPKWHFVLRGILMVMGIVMVAIALLYFVSFIHFALRETGLLFALAFGAKGLGIFLRSLPWILVLLVLCFIALLELLVKKYSFGYRKPLLYSVLVIVFFIGVGSFVLIRVGLHQRLYHYTEAHDVPLARPLYREYHLGSLKDVHVGVIDEITDEGFVLVDNRGETIAVTVLPGTRFPYGIDFDADDVVMVLGAVRNGEIDAYGIRKVEEAFELATTSRRGWFSPFPPHFMLYQDAE